MIVINNHDQAHPKPRPSHPSDPAPERIKTNNIINLDKIYLDKINNTRNSIIEIDKIYLDKILK